ncbi:TM0106 family RecB-like putative nuclease [Corynebacterium anserum]
MNYSMCPVDKREDPPAPLTPADVVGCRHRAVLRRVKSINTPERMRTLQDLENQIQYLSHHIAEQARRQKILAQLPGSPRRGDKVRPTRIDISPGPNAVEDTLEAMARGIRLITGAVLEEGALSTTVDILLRRDMGHGTDPTLAYAPLVISGHSVARRLRGKQAADCLVIDLSALSLSHGVEVPLRHRALAGDSQRLAMAYTILSVWGVASGDVGLIGRAGAADPERCYIFPGDSLLPGLLTALREPVPHAPSRVKECSYCEYHNHCRAQLLERQDVSLMLPGDRNRALREAGIRTLPQLAEAQRGEQSALAEAWMKGETALRRPLRRWITDTELWGGYQFVMPRRGDLTAQKTGQTPETSAQPMQEQLANVIDIDIDMEAHPQRGTFLWGTFDGAQYVAFGDFSSAGDEGAHVAEFWAWIQARVASAAASGKRLRVWVYAEQGENYWLRHYARKFGGRAYTLADATTVTMPTLDEVNRFIASEQWCDLFRIVNNAVAGTGSLGLKTVAPLAGFQFSQKGVDGRAAITLYEQAIRTARGTAQAARRTLERYNADDCVANSYVRTWLRKGAPGIPQCPH